MKLFHAAPAMAALLFAGPPAMAKPIAFQNGFTAMAEYGAGTMTEVQSYYAPQYWYSVGGGHLRIDADDGSFSRDISYVRTNALLKRWNLPKAQANIFAFGGLGRAESSDVPGSDTVGQAGLQADYETLRVYVSAKTEFHHATTFDHRIDTLQAGFAPYPHRYEGIATWVIGQARTYTGGIYSGVEAALLLRFFGARRWGSVWFEAGPTLDGKLQSMVMFNF